MTDASRTDAYPDRERLVAEVFVSIADSLAEGSDIQALYSRLTSVCTGLLDVAAASLVLSDDRGVLHVMAASSERARHLEWFQLQAAEGPGLDCARTGSPVSVPDLTQGQAQASWPRFAVAAVAAGFPSVHALPMRLRENVLGSLNLFGTTTGTLNTEDLRLGRAFAHVTSVALVAGRAAAAAATVNTQLQTALTSRVILEQAKGVVAQRGGLDMDQAFAVLRRYSRDHNQKLADIAGEVVSRGLLPDLLLEHARVKGVLAGPRAR